MKKAFYGWWITARPIVTFASFRRGYRTINRFLFRLFCPHIWLVEITDHAGIPAGRAVYDLGRSAADPAASAAPAVLIGTG